jgi:hypothetical protein
MANCAGCDLHNGHTRSAQTGRIIVSSEVAYNYTGAQTPAERGGCLPDERCLARPWGRHHVQNEKPFGLEETTVAFGDSIVLRENWLMNIEGPCSRGMNRLAVVIMTVFKVVPEWFLATGRSLT